MLPGEDEALARGNPHVRTRPRSAGSSLPSFPRQGFGKGVLGPVTQEG